jgi:RimJ/RimL family protein N-acetyltransferase
MALTFRPFVESDFERVKSWADAPEIRRWIEYPTPLWFHYITNTPNVYGWIVYDGDQAVGYVQMDVIEEGRVGCPMIIVRADLHGHGYGTQMLRDLLLRPEVSRLERVEAEVEIGNVASERAALAAGFQRANEAPPTDGFIKFVYSR